MESKLVAGGLQEGSRGSAGVFPGGSRDAPGDCKGIQGVPGRLQGVQGFAHIATS